MSETKVLLPESEIPHAWYNLQADLPKPMAPPLHPGTGNPIGPDDLSAIFPMSLIAQEVCTDKWVDVPAEVLDILSLWRPTPLVRAHRLEKALGTPARIYFKNESVSPAGSHKPNTSVPQAFYNKQAGIRRLTTETGAGQWGCALSMACNYFDLECTVYMVRVSYQQKPYRRSLMQVWGATVHASPTNLTEAGKQFLQKDPDTPGSLGMAISEAVEDAAKNSDANYSLGSVLNHVLLHQTVIGLETQKQFKSIGDEPDIVIGCVGGGSNFAGLAFPYVGEKIGGRDVRIVAVEPTACPTLTKGKYAYDFGDTAMSTPLLKMHTLGHNFVPSGIHAGGLRYHGMAPLVSHIYDLGLVEAAAYTQNSVFESAVLFARTEGIIPAPESSHAIRSAVDEGLKCKETGEEKCIVFNLSGHGHFDMTAYDAYLSGKLDDFEYSTQAVEESLAEVAALQPKG